MKRITCILCALSSLLVIAGPIAASFTHPMSPPSLLHDSADPPAAPVKLIFIHHSTGGNWLADPNNDQPYGGLGRALMQNNYFVSATNYGWGPDQIGSNTDIGHWWDWFRGENAETYMTALYNESGQNFCNPTADPPYECFGEWPRLATDPGGPNEIVMFKGCFPNAHMGGNPTDPPNTGDNPLRGQSAWLWDDEQGKSVPNPYHTVSNAKGIYNDLLVYFAAHQEKLFVVITGPPLLTDDMGHPTDAAHAANYRAFNDWLVDDWLDTYPYNNVAVFDYYNVLTSNGGDPNTNDAGQEGGNHHRWWNGAVQHVSPVDNDLAAYAVSMDSHPTTAGHQKATAEFVQVLNVFYNRWKAGGTPCTGLTDVGIAGPTSGYTGTQYTFTAVITPANASAPITYTWTPAPASGQGDATARYTWPMTGTKTITLAVQNCGGSDTATHHIAIVPCPVMSHFVYVPLVLRNAGTTPPAGALVQPGDLTYLGAFRLPGGDDPPQTFAYGGNAMTFNPDHNTLFITGHDRRAYGDLPDGDQIAEVSIPTPVNSRNVEDLPVATFVQEFHNPTAGYFTAMEEIPKVGLQYLNHAATGPLLHIAWGQHLQPDDEPSHGWFNATLNNPQFKGVWFIGNQNLYSVNGYMFDIPTAWADTHAQGRYLATGRMRDGGQGGMGPALFAYRPGWQTGLRHLRERIWQRRHCSCTRTPTTQRTLSAR
ncbi:MAG: PKD domain-containing protein [Anaerolineae bacterium]